MAFQVWNFLATGQGGIDWGGLPLVCTHLGIADFEGLMHRLYAIKTHKTPDK